MRRLVITWASSMLLFGVTVDLSAQPAAPAMPPLPRGTVEHRDVAYVAGGHERHKLDLFVPGGSHDLPLVVLLHGGAFMRGDKRSQNPAPFLAAGYAVAAVNYRLSQHAIFPAQIEDVKAAVRWLRAHAREHGIDPDRIGAHGQSAGAHLAAMLGTAGHVKAFEVGEHLDVSSRVQAVVDYFGPTDFLQMDAHRLSDGPLHDPPDSPESRLVGGPIQERKEAVARANPVTYVTREAPPFLIAHGDRDLLVPHHQSELLAAALQKAGVPVVLHTVEGGGHGFKDAVADGLMMEFFARHLKPRPPAGR